jgi:hypothetical protein
MEKFGSGMEKIQIRDKHPGYATLLGDVQRLANRVMLSITIFFINNSFLFHLPWGCSETEEPWHVPRLRQIDFAIS